MSFYIYENGTFKNRNQLTNPVSRMLYHFFEWYVGTRYVYSNLLTGVEIHSQHRADSPTHSQNKAVDFAVYPLWMNPFVFNLIHRFFKLNIYLSLHNRHIHLDSTRVRFINGQWRQWANKKLVEVKNVDDKVFFIDPKKEYFLGTPRNWINGNNVGVADRYDFAEMKTALDSIFAGIRLSTTEQGRCVYAAYTEFETYYAENAKMTVPAVDMVREYVQHTGEAISNIVNDVRTIFDPTKIVLTIAGVLLVFYAIDKISESGAEKHDDGKEENDNSTYLIE